MSMTLLDRHFTKRLLATVIKAAVALVLIVIIVDFLTARRREVERYDVPWAQIVEYYAAFVPIVLFKYQAAAVSMLLAGLFVFGRAAQDNEVTAALAGGVSLRRLAFVPLLTALALSVAVFFVSDTVGVAAFERFDRVDKEYFRRYAPGERHGISWTNLTGGWTAHIGKFNSRAFTGEDIVIHSVTPEYVQDIQAGRIFWDAEQNRWMLEDGRWFVFDRVAQRERTERITQAPAPFTEPPERLFALDLPPDAKAAHVLRRDLHLARGLGMPVQAQWVDYHAKFAQPALLFIMMLLSVPFAMRTRRGGVAISFGLSVTIGLAYVFVFFVSMGLGHIQKLPPVLAAWLPNLLFLAAGLWMLRRTPT